jgi:hypothetical protein
MTAVPTRRGRLPVKVEPVFGESLMSLIVRACQANIIERPHHLLKLAGCEFSTAAFAPFAAGINIDGLAELLDIDRSEVKRRWHPTFNREGTYYVHWHGIDIDRTFIESNSRRIPPSFSADGVVHLETSLLRTSLVEPQEYKILRDRLENRF